MKLPDANLLIYAINEDAREHKPALAWWEQLLSGSETVALAWSVLVTTIRIVTHPTITERPLGVETALEVVDSWLQQPVTTLVSPTPRHVGVLRQLLVPRGIGGNLVPDAHLAALAIEHGAELCSSDYDFGRFPGLRWADPLRLNTA